MKINLHCAFITKKEVTIQDTLMYSYTFCDLASGNNFTVFSLTKDNKFEILKQLQICDCDFELQITKTGALKLKPIKEG